MRNVHPRGLRPALLACSALVAATAWGADATAQTLVVDAAGANVTVNSNRTGDPGVLITARDTSVTVRSGVTVRGTGNNMPGLVWEPHLHWLEAPWTEGQAAIDIQATGGSVTVQSGGRIEAEHIAIHTRGLATQDAHPDGRITVNNAGSIIGKMDDGVRIANFGRVVNSGTIIGGRDIDTAIIPHTFGGDSSMGDGVSFFVVNVRPEDVAAVRATDFLSQVENSGRIEGVRFGIISSGPSQIVNSGVIHGHMSGVLQQGAGIFVTGASGPEQLFRRERVELINSGTITSSIQTAVTLRSLGATESDVSLDLHTRSPDEWSQFFDAHDPAASDAIVINSGVIRTKAPASAVIRDYIPIDPDNWPYPLIDPVTGDPVRVIVEEDFSALYVQSGDGYILNTADGIIRSDDGASAIRLQSTDPYHERLGVIFLDNQGEIIGDIVGSDGQEIIRNDGVIEGHVGLGYGDDLLVIGPDSRITGKVDLGHGDDVLMWDTHGVIEGTVTGGAGDNVLALILGGDNFDSSKVFNFQTIRTFGGGSLQDVDLSGFAQIDVNEGASLNLNSTGFSGFARVAAGGALTGTGQVSQIYVYSQGRLAPGNSIGLITVTGDVTLEAGTVYDVEVGRRGSDQVLADGSVTVEGGVVNVTGEDGVDLAPGAGRDSYVILAGAAGLTGEFDTLTETLRFYDARLAYTGTEVLLVLEPVGADFIAAARTANELSVGTVLYNGLLPASGDFLQAMKDTFPGLNRAGVRQGLNVLSGPIHAWAPVAVSEIGVQAGRAAARSAFAAAGTHEVWATGLITTLEVDPAAGSVGADLDIQGGAFGFNAGVSETLNAGVFAGYAQGDGTDQAGGRLDTSGWFLGAQARVLPAEGISLGAQLGYLDQTADTRRDIAIGSLRRTALSSYDVSGWFLNLDAAWLHPVGETWRAGVFAEAALGSYEADGVAETGAGSLSLTGQPVSFDRSSWRAGVRVAGDSGWVRPRLDVGLQMEGGSRAALAGFQFAGTPGRFQTRGPALEAQAPFVSLGADFSLSERVSATVSYDGVFGDALESHGALARVAFVF